jgi:hypothetical protein
MRTAAYINKLTGIGMAPKTAQVHGEAIEDLLGDEFVTREHFDTAMARLDVRFTQADAKVDRKFEQLDAKINRIQSSIELRIQEAKVDIVHWFIGHSIAFVAMVFTIAKVVK